MLQFCGGRALSPFRLEKLLKEIKARQLPVLAITTEFWHFCALHRELNADETTALAQLLNEAPSQKESRQSELLFLVLPRPGTISPWSSKATDIARHCGLSAVERIERGLAYYVQTDRVLWV